MLRERIGVLSATVVLMPVGATLAASANDEVPSPNGFLVIGSSA
jgi:hypothetical protein